MIFVEITEDFAAKQGACRMSPRVDFAARRDNADGSDDIDGRRFESLVLLYQAFRGRLSRYIALAVLQALTLFMADAIDASARRRCCPIRGRLIRALLVNTSDTFH